MIGFDADAASIDDARRHAAAAGVEVTFQALPAVAVAGHGPFDVVVVLETLHDLARPVDALVACRSALRRGGAVVVADEMVADRFTAPGDETERFMYGFSVLHCLPASLAEQGSAALGTVLRARPCTGSPPPPASTAARRSTCPPGSSGSTSSPPDGTAPPVPGHRARPQKEPAVNATTSTTATTDADPDDVFGLLTDIDRLAEWNHIITRVLHRPTDLAPGAEWVVEMHAMGQTWSSRSRVEAIDRPTRRFSYRSGTDDANPSYTVWHWSIEPHPGGSLVSVSWDLNPRTFWRRHLVVHLRRRALAQEVPASIRALESAARRHPAVAVH